MAEGFNEPDTPTSGSETSHTTTEASEESRSESGPSAHSSSSSESLQEMPSTDDSDVSEMDVNEGNAQKFISKIYLYMYSMIGVHPLLNTHQKCNNTRIKMI